MTTVRSRARRVPRMLREAPRLDPRLPPQRVTPRAALLISPFYPKAPHASYGKRVPTPAVTGFAGATPPDWSVRYLDENLLQGPPPVRPFPQVVAITVHLTFARRAFELARWYRDRGAKVVFGGLHVVSNADECAPHADALVVGDGCGPWPDVLRDVERGTLRKVYTAHVVFRPKRMTAEDLAAGYEYCYDRTFSHRCVWRRRPRDWRAVPAYLAMAYLYKKSNWLWPLLIRHRLTHWAWRPLIEASRRRHLRFRKRLAMTQGRAQTAAAVGLPVYASV